MMLLKIRELEPRRALIAVLCLLSIASTAAAQPAGPWARIARSVGIAQRTVGSTSSTFTVKVGALLAPRDEIRTGANGKVVIELHDESKVTVMPNSWVRIEDFRAQPLANRSLVHVFSGQIQVKIYHQGNKTNPYRLSSPAASIAVRGTKFIVDVQEATGETLVVVTEGLVEVSSAADSTDSRLVRRGESVIVRIGARIGLTAPGPGGELNGEGGGYSGDPSRRLSASYQRSVDAVAQSSLETQPIQFSAFPDAHLDSLENPAFMSDFRQAQARLLLLPSVRRTEKDLVRGIDNPMAGGSDEFPYRGKPHQFDNSFTPQLSFFTPLGDSHYTIGGSVSAVRTSLQALSLYQSSEAALSRLLTPNNFDGGAAEVIAVNTSLGVARRFGGGRTSLGFQLDHLSSDGSYLNVWRSYDSVASGGGFIESKADITRTRATIGASYEFSPGKKLSAFYRYGVAKVDQENRSRDLSNHYNKPFDRSDVLSFSQEVGLRWRSPLARRVFYGLESSYMVEYIQSHYQPGLTTSTKERDHAGRARFGGGMGFALPRNTLFAFDLMGGVFRTTKPSVEGPIDLFRYRSERGHFASGHAAVQTDIASKAFASASFLLTARKSRYDSDAILRIQVPDISYIHLSAISLPYNESYTGKFTNLGVGWKFKPTMITEYLYSIDHTRRSPSHSVLFRYTFDMKIFGEH